MLTLSPDLFPRPRLRHWLIARGSTVVAWRLALAGGGEGEPDVKALTLWQPFYQELWTLSEEVEELERFHVAKARPTR